MNLQDAIQFCSDNRAFVFFRSQYKGERSSNKSKSVTVSLSDRGRKAEGLSIDLMDTRKPEEMFIEACKLAKQNLAVAKTQPIPPRENKPANGKGGPRGQQGKDKSNPFDKNRGTSSNPGPRGHERITVLPGEKLAKAAQA